MSRRDAEDQIVDLVIVAEALFLSGGDKQELRHRASLRAAKLLSRDGFNPHDVNRTMKEAYDVRSKIVHGTEVKPGASFAALVKLLPRLTVLIRKALILGVNLSDDDNDFGTDVFWDGLFLGADVGMTLTVNSTL